MKICEILNYGSDVVFSNQKALKQQKFTKCEKYLGVVLFALCSVVTVSAYFFYQYFQHKKIEHIQKEELKKELVENKVDQAFQENKIANKNSEIKVVLQEEPVVKKTVEQLKELVAEPQNEKKKKENPIEQTKERVAELHKEEKSNKNPVEQSKELVAEPQKEEKEKENFVGQAKGIDKFEALNKDSAATKQVEMHHLPENNEADVRQQELLNNYSKIKNEVKALMERKADIIDIPVADGSVQPCDKGYFIDDYMRPVQKPTMIDIHVSDGSIQSFEEGHFIGENIRPGQIVKFNDQFFHNNKDTPYRPDETFKVVGVTIP